MATPAPRQRTQADIVAANAAARTLILRGGIVGGQYLSLIQH